MTGQPDGDASPAVTVGIAFRDDVDFLGLAIRSVFAQTLTNWELLLVDDGSGDGSLQLARAVQDPRVHVCSDGRNLGLAARLNQVTAAARAPLIARMDADDAMTPGRLDQQRQEFAGGAVDLVATAAWTMDAKSRPYGIRGGLPPPVDGRGFLKKTAYIHPSVMATREWFRANPYDETLLRAQDRELWCRTYTHTASKVLPEPGLFYRAFGMTTSKPKYTASCRADRRVVRRYGPPLAGLPATAIMLTESMLKQAFHSVVMDSFIGQRIVEHRSTPLSPEQLMRARAQLTTIENTVVPGIPVSGQGLNRLRPGPA